MPCPEMRPVDSVETFTVNHGGDTPNGSASYVSLNVTINLFVFKFSFNFNKVLQYKTCCTWFLSLSLEDHLNVYFY